MIEIVPDFAVRHVDDASEVQLLGGETMLKGSMHSVLSRRRNLSVPLVAVLMQRRCAVKHGKSMC